MRVMPVMPSASGEATVSPPAAVRVVAVLIVRDEAHNLHDCLMALRALVDAIVVVDTGSRDGSAEIAASLGAVVGYFPWNGRFDDARNHALAVAKSVGRFDFFLSVDADERVSALCDAKERWRDNLDPRAHVGATVSFIAREDSLPYDEPRLFALRDDLRWHNALHETPLVDAYRLQHTEGLGFGQVPLRFLHLGYSVDAKARKRQRDLAMLEAAVVEQPDRSYIFMELANTLSALDRHDEAAVAWDRAVALTRAELRASAGGLDVMSWRSNAPPYEAVQSGVLGGALAYRLARQGTLDAEGQGLLAEARGAFPRDDFLRWLEIAHLASRGAHEEVLEGGLALLREPPAERRGVPISLFAQELPKLCALSAVALGRLSLARELCADPELRRRIDAMSAGRALARSTRVLSLPPDAELTDQGDGGLVLELEGERVFFHGTSAFVVASLAEPTSPEQIARELATIAGRPLADAEDAVARSLRLLVFSGMLSLDGSALAGRPVAHYDAESTTVLCFGLPATLAGARRRAREVLDLARAQNLSPVLLPEPSQPYATAAVARGLLELGSAEAAALLDRAPRARAPLRCADPPRPFRGAYARAGARAARHPPSPRGPCDLRAASRRRGGARRCLVGLAPRRGPHRRHAPRAGLRSQRAPRVGGGAWRRRAPRARRAGRRGDHRARLGDRAVLPMCSVARSRAP
ncbi:MAG: glycosyltransferase family 2 protein [Myxococcales bacterium]|nr:glycosyltransferase family 2 protein [Myxococcales bacterium]